MCAPAETLVDKAMTLEYFGGAYGNIRKPTPFLCLILKMLQIQVALESCFQPLTSSMFAARERHRRRADQE